MEKNGKRHQYGNDARARARRRSGQQQFRPARLSKKRDRETQTLQVRLFRASNLARRRTRRRRKILGANNEKLADVKPAVVAALRDLMLQFRAEGLVARRHEIRRIKQARLFWQGLQYAWWNPNDMSWHLPFESQITDDQTLQEMPRYQFVTNIYQAFGLSFVALLSQDTPATRFYPQSAQNEVDLAAAKAASDVAEFVEQNNKVEQLLTGVAYYLWTDGKIGGYVRFVADGQRFGWHDEDVVEEVTIRLGEDEYACGGCGARTPAGKNTQIGEESGTPRNFLAGIMCPSCGSELMESDFSPAEMITIPRVVGSRRVPNGQEVITVIGGLELNTPVWANEMHEFPYLQWQQEVHSAKLRAAYPHVADKIEQGGSNRSRGCVRARVAGGGGARAPNYSAWRRAL